MNNETRNAYTVIASGPHGETRCMPAYAASPVDAMAFAQSYMGLAYAIGWDFIAIAK